MTQLGVLRDSCNKKSYEVVRFFGKGGFAKCYEVIDMASNESYACKIVPKHLILKKTERDKMVQEIQIHSKLENSNIVKFFSSFEDSVNIYIVLELCKKRSMVEMLKRRRTVTEYECRYYIHQIIQGVKYLHDHKIVHRDLKLGNFFLDDLLHVKIGDFGLAARIEFSEERKRTICGTPNYMAPEILTKAGHSYEVDIWAIGCTMFTLLVGKPPFETRTLKETYMRIRTCDFKLPIDMNRYACEMIVAMLQDMPDDRPSIHKLNDFKWMKLSVIPEFLPKSCLTMAPRFEDYETAIMRPYEVTNIADGTFVKTNLHDSIRTATLPFYKNGDYIQDLKSVYNHLSDLLNANIRLLDHSLSDEMTDPGSQPIYWVTKWVDYSSKYGFGYQLCDKAIGVMFNDMTNLILMSNQMDIHFINHIGHEYYMTKKDYITTLEKKIKLLTLFQKYMNENLVTSGGDIHVKSDTVSRLPHLHAWSRTPAAVVMYLTNGTIQFNFTDHIKVIFCARMGAVAYMDGDHDLRTYRFETILQHGINKDICQRIVYAHSKIKKFIEMYEN